VAHHKDALKRIRQTEKRTERNKSIKTFYRNQVKEVKAAVAAGQPEAAQAALVKAIRALDRATSKSILHRNTAARYKSRLSRSVASLASSKTPAQT
jgi:small subunit ribosomal protein S20